MLAPRKFLFALTCGIFSGMVVVAGINYLVDPYGIYNLTDSDQLRSKKPTAATKGPMVKAYQLERTNARTLVLGNSRAEVGFDPLDPVWPQENRPIYNAALPGTGPRTALLYLQHALTSFHPDTIVIGVDFMDFLAAPKAPMMTNLPPSELESRLRTTLDGNPNPYRPQQQLRDIAATIFSLDALLDSIQTIAARNDPFAVDLTPRGFNPMKDYIRIAREEGYRAIFLQRDEENIKAYLKRPHSIYLENSTTTPPLEDIRHIIALCKKNNIRLKLVIYPYHARLLEIIDATGHWDAFEQWKMALARIVQEAEPSFVTLWDFSGYNTYTMESVPSKRDMQTQTKWYWEAGHFKKELGSVILGRMFSTRYSAEDAANPFGSVVTLEMLPHHLENIRRQRNIYWQRFPADVTVIRSMVRK